jgi:hypothetical protein
MKLQYLWQTVGIVFIHIYNGKLLDALLTICSDVEPVLPLSTRCSVLETSPVIIGVVGLYNLARECATTKIGPQNALRPAVAYALAEFDSDLGEKPSFHESMQAAQGSWQYAVEIDACMRCSN